MDFVKMEGLGNDFVVLEGPRRVAPDEVSAWCDRRRGIGADGVLVVTPLGGNRVRMEYWNADGSPAEMCGNGLRCAARFAVDRDWAEGPDVTVATAVGDHPCRVGTDGRVRAFLGTAGTPGEPLRVGGVEAQPVAVGNPHAVVLVDDVAAAPVQEVGPKVETDPAFPDRTNVEFLTVRAADHLELRVWERGVGETLACGTGAAAAMVVAHHRGVVGERATVSLPGGDLDVEVQGDAVWIEGPARYVFAGTVT